MRGTGAQGGGGGGRGCRTLRASSSIAESSLGGECNGFTSSLTRTTGAEPVEPVMAGVERFDMLPGRTLRQCLRSQALALGFGLRRPRRASQAPLLGSSSGTNTRALTVRAYLPSQG